MKIYLFIFYEKNHLEKVVFCRIFRGNYHLYSFTRTLMCNL